MLPYDTALMKERISQGFDNYEAFQLTEGSLPHWHEGLLRSAQIQIRMYRRLSSPLPVMSKLKFGHIRLVMSISTSSESKQSIYKVSKLSITDITFTCNIPLGLAVIEMEGVVY